MRETDSHREIFFIVVDEEMLFLMTTCRFIADYFSSSGLHHVQNTLVFE